MLANERIRSARLASGLTDVDVACKAGLSIYEYGDVEQHADEFCSVLTLRRATDLAEVLDLDVLDLVPEDLTSEPSGADDHWVSLEERRRKRGLSLQELSDAFGFEAGYVASLEKDSALLWELPIDALYDLSLALGLPKGKLLKDFLRMQKGSGADAGSAH